MSNNLLLQASYTYSHSIDTASNDAGFGGFATLFTSEKGNSDFDVRHNVNVSGSYQIPSGGKMPAFAAPAFKGWWTDFVFATRTGLPFDVTGLSSTSSNSTATSAAARGLFAQVRPNLLAGSVFVSDPTAPGGRRLNINVFGTPTGFQQGNLGRNALTGYGMYQLDMSLRREIMLGERRRLNLSAQAFNILNHPNFANPQPNEGANLASSNFGVSSRMLNQGVGGGSLGSVYRTGGPRSLQLVMRFQF